MRICTLPCPGSRQTLSAKRLMDRFSLNVTLQCTAQAYHTAALVASQCVTRTHGGLIMTLEASRGWKAQAREVHFA
jgi:hypothetical protein